MQHHKSKSSAAALLTLAAACITPGNVHAEWNECSVTQYVEPRIPHELPESSSAGCTSKGESKTHLESSVGRMRIGIFNRKYLVEIPAGYDSGRAYPLIFAFHGAGGNAETYRDGEDGEPYGGLGETVNDEAIIVYGQAKLIWPAPAIRLWDTSGQGDIKYFKQILARLKSEACIDTDKVFATGHSSGAFFSSRLGCEHGDKLRGIAPLAGDLRSTPDHGDCNGSVAVWIESGANDAKRLVEGGEDLWDYWVGANGGNLSGGDKCDAACTAADDDSPHLTCGDFECPETCGSETCRRYDDGHNPVVWCVDAEGAHEARSAFTAPGAWNFFKSLDNL